MLSDEEMHVATRSSWYESAPVPPSNQPWFLNGVARLTSLQAPSVILRRLHDIEAELGRVRNGGVNAARAADLDLLDVHGEVTELDNWPRLPHPRMHERAFVLQPLAEVAPEWRHPVSGESAAELLQRIPVEQQCLRVPDEAGTSNVPSSRPA